ncbi:hypothetical protein [Sporisorium scitamineum]|uniref:Uncharacterized protein n=1 Tax=Sporisorium scitamineum TaxID=49012 RepID=A0A0F7RTP0_9BASI|nr:hypothetical protein [Sporisorium scitamineum]
MINELNYDQQHEQLRPNHCQLNCICRASTKRLQQHN